MIPRKQQFSRSLWRTHLPLVLLLAAGCSKTGSMADQPAAQIAKSQEALRLLTAKGDAVSPEVAQLTANGAGERIPALLQAKPPDRSAAPHLITGKASGATRDRARNKPSTEGPRELSRATASKPRTDVSRTSRIDGTSRPNDEPIQTRRTVPPPPPNSSRVEPAQKPIGDGPASEIRHARFLIKAGLSPLAVESLRRMIKEFSGTPTAQAAQQALDSFTKAK